jgi:hypothetical protein
VSAALQALCSASFGTAVGSTSAEAMEAISKFHHMYEYTTHTFTIQHHGGEQKHAKLHWSWSRQHSTNEHDLHTNLVKRLQNLHLHCRSGTYNTHSCVLMPHCARGRETRLRTTAIWDEEGCGDCTKGQATPLLLVSPRPLQRAHTPQVPNKQHRRRLRPLPPTRIKMQRGDQRGLLQRHR